MENYCARGGAVEKVRPANTRSTEGHSVAGTIVPLQRNRLRDRHRTPMLRIAAPLLLATLVAVSPVVAEELPGCAAAPPVLWGDGEHDDTAALNTWFRGETVVWAKTHEKVGSVIADRRFLLSSTIYVHGGTDRRLERFRMFWPHRDEIVSGGTILTGSDPKEPPTVDDITKVNADPDEGVPYDGSALEPHENDIPRRCMTS